MKDTLWQSALRGRLGELFLLCFHRIDPKVPRQVSSFRGRSSLFVSAVFFTHSEMLALLSQGRVGWRRLVGGMRVGVCPSDLCPLLPNPPALPVSYGNIPAADGGWHQSRGAASGLTRQPLRLPLDRRVELSYAGCPWRACGLIETNAAPNWNLMDLKLCI